MELSYKFIHLWTGRYLRETTNADLVPWPEPYADERFRSILPVTREKRGSEPTVRGTRTNGAWTRANLAYYLSLIDRLMSGRYDPRTFEGGLVMDHSPAAHDWLWHYKALVDAQA